MALCDRCTIATDTKRSELSRTLLDNQWSFIKLCRHSCIPEQMLSACKYFGVLKMPEVMPRVRAENTNKIPLWMDDYRGGVGVSHQGFRAHSYEIMISGAVPRCFECLSCLGRRRLTLATRGTACLPEPFDDPGRRWDLLKPPPVLYMLANYSADKSASSMRLH